MSHDTADAHLDLADLVTRASGQAIEERASDHLAGCAACQREASRWSLVADGVRGLAADNPGAVPEARRPSRARRGPRPAPGRPRRRTLVVIGSVAAAVLLAGIGTATGLAHGHTSGHESRPGPQLNLTSVSGCAPLKQATGTLERTDGSSAVIKLASGQLVTVTTSPATRMSTFGTLSGDVTDGAAVIVVGGTENGTLDANFINVGFRLPARELNGSEVQGTVADAGSGGFTVVTATGARVRVALMSITEVNVAEASVAQLHVGAGTIAVGHLGPDGTLSGQLIIQPLPSVGTQGVRVTVKNCSGSAIDDEITALAAGG